MRIEDKIKNHLMIYRVNTGLNQKEMAAMIGVAYATYQEMETKGIVRKVDVLQKLKDKTGFDNTQKTVYESDSKDAENVSQLLKIISQHAETINSQQQTIKSLVEKIKPETHDPPKEDSPPLNLKAVKPEK